MRAGREDREGKKKWKTYKEIQAENRTRKVESGWRGRKMQGSGMMIYHQF